MCCTFGDLTDVTWWRELDLPVRTIIGRDGRMSRETPPWLAGDGAAAAYEDLAGKTAFSAREAWSRCCARAATSRATRRRRTRMANFYENGDKPLEIVATRQWYIRNGGREPELRADAGRARRRDHLAARRTCGTATTTGSNGLNGDWLDLAASASSACPSRCGTRSTSDGEPDHDHPLLPREDELPVDPSTDAPQGYDEAQRGKPGGFVGDPDVMDTWATSSLTPHIAGGWETDPDLFERVFPMDLCTQAHDIIRTWLFSRVVRAHFENGTVPWTPRDDLRLRARPRPQEDVEVEGQRRRPDRDAREVRLRRGALARRHGAARAWTRRSTRAR